jgi:epoxyqueuosine reductase
VKEVARSLGFNLVGIAPAGPSVHRDYFRQWLDDGKAGEMAYLDRRFDERTDPGRLLEGAQSVVSVAMNYHVPLKEPADLPGGPAAKIARYALGDDYHELIKPKLYAIADMIRDLVPGALTRCGVDTAPIMEKELAARAGIGWVAKNTNIVNPHLGSWFYLGSIITTVDLPPDAPAIDHCGTCTRCIDACPTGAITAPYQLDARRCISYLTIEHHGPIEPELASNIGNWLYGCDICQDVCPFNSKAIDTLEPALQPRFETGTLDAEEVLTWDEPTYHANTRRAATRRVKLPLLQRNARIVLENVRSAAGENDDAGYRPDQSQTPNRRSAAQTP